MTPFQIWRLCRRPRLKADQLRELQNRRLRQIIRHASAQVPYYRELFRAAGIAAADIQTAADLHSVPVTEKGDLLAAGVESLLRRDTDPAKCVTSRTSGSSGEPLSTYLSKEEHRTRRLLGIRRLLDAGVRPWDRICTLSDPIQSRSKRYRTSVVPVAAPAEDQLSTLQELEPTVLKAWPSSLKVLMHQATPRLRHFVSPRVVVMSGEHCPYSLRRRIESELGAEVFLFYSSGELGPIAAECKAHNGMHLNADQMIIETDGARSSEEGGDLLITSLSAFTMPFLRYRIGDTGLLVEEECPCGSPFPLLRNLQGQASRIIQLPDGKMASVAAVVNTALRLFPSLVKFHLVQEALGEFDLRAVFLQPPEAETLAEMRDRLRECLAADVEVRITVTDSIDEDGVRKFGNFTRLQPLEPGRCLEETTTALSR